MLDSEAPGTCFILPDATICLSCGLQSHRHTQQNGQGSHSSIRVSEYQYQVLCSEHVRMMSLLFAHGIAPAEVLNVVRSKVSCKRWIICTAILESELVRTEHAAIIFVPFLSEEKPLKLFFPLVLPKVYDPNRPALLISTALTSPSIRCFQ